MKLLLAALAVALVPLTQTQAMELATDRALSAKAHRAARDETVRTVHDFQKPDLSRRTQKALNGLVFVGTNELKKRGFGRAADQWKSQWEENFVNYFENVDLLGLGDHAPLNKWLTGFYRDLEAKLGRTICEALYLTDILVFNYAIPVVFHPLGLKGDTWSIVEYRKHFVPFAAATAYWAAQIGCLFVTDMLGSVMCSFAAVIPRYAMQDVLAAPLSDFVYNAAHGLGSKPRRYDIDALLERYRVLFPEAPRRLHSR